MSSPSALTVVYPPSFQNSFWSYPSYRPGAQSLYAKLQAGLDENESILAFVAHRAELEYNHAEALATPPPAPSFPAPLFRQAAGILHEVLPIDNAGGSAAPRGFAANSSATSRAFRMIQAETNTAHANAHGKVARHLEKSILEPFGRWAADHRTRVTQSWEHVDATLARFERQKSEVDKLKHSYENKCRAADEAEDDARFAPIDEADLPSPPPSHASDSTLRPPAAAAAHSQRRSVSGDSTKSIDSHTDDTNDPDRLKRRETLRKQFGFTQRATSATHSPPAHAALDGVKLPPLPTETEGEAMDASAASAASLAPPAAHATSLKRSGTISALVSSAVDKMPAPLKAAVGGVVSAEPRHARLRRDADNAEKVYEEAVRNLDRTRCQLEEVLFEHYGLTQRWEADRIRAVHSVLASYNHAVAAEIPILQQSSARSFQSSQGLDPSLELRALIRQARTGPFRPAIERFQPYYHDETSLGRKVGPHGVAHAWLVKNGGFGLDLSLVERLEYLERLEHQPSAPESDNSTQLATVPPVLAALLAALDRAYADEERWTALAKAFAAANAPAPADQKSETQSAEDKAADEPDAKLIGQEKRKIWILEVPLPITHRLRDALIAHLNPSLADLIYGGTNGTKAADAVESPANLIPEKLLDSYDAPVLAACIKLWLLELEHSLITEELWDQIDAIYRAAAGQEHEALAAATPVVGSSEEAPAAAKDGEPAATPKASAIKRPEVDEATKAKIRAGVLEDLRVVLNKLPRIHLACLDALFSHLHRLVASTHAAEADAVYANKLGLALGRALVRPRHESAYTLSSQIGTLVVYDLLHHYDDILPELVEKKRTEAAAAAAAAASPNAKGAPADGQRRMPIRKRTKPIDQRISRSSIGSDLQQGARKLMQQMDERERSKVEPTPIVTSSDAVTAEAKRDDDIAAPTPLAERVLGASAAANEPAKEAETVSVVDDSAEQHKEQQSEEAAQAQSAAAAAAGAADERPLSNVARLSRQFNSASSTGSAGSKRSSLGGAGPRGPRAPSSRTPSTGVSDPADADPK